MKLSGDETMFMSGSNESGHVKGKGCVTKGNKNISRPMYGGGRYSLVPDTEILNGPKSGRMAVETTHNCGIDNPLNHGAGTQFGGNYSSLEEGNAVYGFDSANALKGVPKGAFSYAPITEKSHTSCNTVTVGGYRKKHRITKHKKRKHKRKGGKSRKKTRKSRSKSHNKKHKAHKKRKTRGLKRHKKNKTRKNKMKGGYHQFNSNVPNSAMYSFSPSVSSGAGSLASPMPYVKNNNCSDVYNHYTKTNTEV